MRAPLSCARLSGRAATRGLLASALALSLAGTGLVAIPRLAVAAEPTADAPAPADAATPANATPAPDAPAPADGAAPASDAPAADGTLRDATDAELQALASHPLAATLDRDLYGAVKNPMQLTFHDRTVSFVDIDGGATSGRTSLYDEQSLYKAAVAQQIDDWSALAFNIFGYADTDNSKLYTDHAGNGFEKDFGSGAHYLNLYEALRGGAASEGKKGKDCWRASGLSYASSLAGAYNALTEAMSDTLGGSGDLNGDEFRKHCPIGALSDSAATQPVIYTNVVQTDRAGATYKYYCNGFGIAFYDFEIHPLSDGEELNAASEGEGGYTYVSKTDEQSFVTDTKNDTCQPNTLSMTLTKTASESITNSTSASETTSFGQQIGVNVSFEKALGKNKLDVGGNFNVSFEEAYSTAYGTGTTLEKSVDSSATVGVALPAHTVACAQQTSADSVLQEDYDEPVGITFKVAVYSINAECYQDDVACAYFSTAGYDQYTFCTLFGDAEGLKTDAADALRMRAVDHVSEPSFESAYGAVTTWGRYGEDKLIHAIDWGSVLAPRSNTAASVDSGRLERMTTTYPMSVDGASVSVQASSVDTVLQDPEPLYPIESIVVSCQFDRDKELRVGDDYALSSKNVNRIQALDWASVDYYGFVPSKGTWKVVDASGSDVNADGSPYVSDVIEIVNDDVTHEQTIHAKAPGEAYVKYFIPEDTYVDANGVVSTNVGLNSAAYKFVVTEQAAPAFEGTVVLSGAPQLTVGEPANLNALPGVSVAAYDATGREVEASVSWEAQELSSRGITVTPDGTVLASQPGTFHVRAYVGDVYSDWMELTAVEAAPAEPGEPETPAEPEQPAEPDAPAEPAAPTYGELATCIYQYGVDAGLISGSPEAGFSQRDYYVMGILYCAAEYVGIVPSETQASVDASLTARYGAEQVEAWRQQAVSVLTDAGVIPAPEAPADQAPAEDVVPTEEEWDAAASVQTPCAGVWACVDAQRQVELVLDAQSSTALLVWDRADGVMGSWAGTADGQGVVTLDGVTSAVRVSGDVLELDYEGGTLQFVRSAW